MLDCRFFRMILWFSYTKLKVDKKRLLLKIFVFFNQFIKKGKKFLLGHFHRSMKDWSIDQVLLIIESVEIILAYHQNSQKSQSFRRNCHLTWYFHFSYKTVLRWNTYLKMKDLMIFIDWHKLLFFVILHNFLKFLHFLRSFCWKCIVLRFVLRLFCVDFI